MNRRGEEVPFWFLLEEYKGYGYGASGKRSLAETAAVGKRNQAGRDGPIHWPSEPLRLNTPPLLQEQIHTAQIMVHSSKPRMIAKSKVAETSRKRLHNTLPPHQRNPSATAEIEVQQMKLAEARKLEIRNQHRRHSQHVQMYNETQRQFREKRTREVKAMSKAASEMVAEAPVPVVPSHLGQAADRVEDTSKRSLPLSTGRFAVQLEYKSLEQTSSLSAFPLQAHSADVFGGGFRRRQPSHKTVAAEDGEAEVEGRGGGLCDGAGRRHNDPRSYTEFATAEDESGREPREEDTRRGDWFGDARIPRAASGSSGCVQLGKLLPLTAMPPTRSEGSWRIAQD